MKKMVSFFGEPSEIFEKLNARAAQYAESLGFSYEWRPQNPFDQTDVVRALREADVGVIDIEPYGEDIFSEIQESTRLLVRFGVGYDKVDLPAASRHGIAVARTTGANTLGVAEMALTLILAARRRLKLNQHCTETGNWAKNVARETIGSTVGIVGFGSIGRALAGLLRGFECNLVAYDPMPDTAAMQALGVKPVSLEELFSTADAVSLHLPYCKETHHLVDERLLATMKPDAVLVNTARGNIVDEDALYRALKDGTLGGAGFDVFGVEPLPVESPLLTLENFVATPHVSSQTEESLWRIYKMAIDISADFFAGRACPHILNPDYGLAAAKIG